MTREQIIKNYSRFNDGYICCSDCPCNDSVKCAACDGRELAYNMIADYFGEPLENDTTVQHEITPETSNVDHPNHYNQGDIECIDAMVAAYGKKAVEIFCLLNAFKYLWRSEHKNGKEDIDKAIWYLRKRLELIGG